MGEGRKDLFHGAYLLCVDGAGSQERLRLMDHGAEVYNVNGENVYYCNWIKAREQYLRPRTRTRKHTRRRRTRKAALGSALDLSTLEAFDPTP